MNIEQLEIYKGKTVDEVIELLQAQEQEKEIEKDILWYREQAIIEHSYYKLSSDFFENTSYFKIQAVNKEGWEDCFTGIGVVIGGDDVFLDHYHECSVKEFIEGLDEKQVQGITKEDFDAVYNEIDTFLKKYS